MKRDNPSLYAALQLGLFVNVLLRAQTLFWTRAGILTALPGILITSAAGLVFARAWPLVQCRILRSAFIALLLAGSVLAAGDTRTTVLGRGAMIGLLGDVGHNCRIGEETLVSGKASISGHCRIGDQVYVAPMAVTTNRIQVGDHAYLGLGAVAIKDVPEDEKQFGNPARKVLEIKKK